MSMSQALTQVTFPIALEGDVDKLEELQWLEYCCQLLETDITLLMHCMQQYVSQLSEVISLRLVSFDQKKAHVVSQLWTCSSNIDCSIAAS